MNINSVNTSSGNLRWIGIKCLFSFPDYLYMRGNILSCVFLMLMINKYPKKTSDFFIDDVFSHLVITTKMESQLFKLNGTRFEVHNVVCSCF